MFQQILALTIILFFIARLFWQKKRGQLGSGELAFWLIFWLAGSIAIINLKELDKLARSLGFSSSGIDILLYLSVLVLFFLIFKIRLRLAKQERAITKLVRRLALDEEEKTNIQK